jgi:hypothetical protein
VVRRLGRFTKGSNCAVALKPTVRAFHCTAFVFLWRVLAMRDLLVVAGVIVVLVLLLAVFAEPGHSPSGPAGHTGRAEDAVQRENPAFVCLALAGGTALLAGLVWMGKLRRRC